MFIFNLYASAASYIYTMGIPRFNKTKVMLNIFVLFSHVYGTDKVTVLSPYPQLESAFTNV